MVFFFSLFDLVRDLIFLGNSLKGDRVDILARVVENKDMESCLSCS